MVKTLKTDAMEDAKKNIFERLKSKFQSNRNSKKTPKSDFGGGSYVSQGSFVVSFNGEKNLGEIGPIRNYVLDYGALRLRSWQSYLESEITQTVINRFCTWVVGKGLKLQAEPSQDVLKEEGITMSAQEFSKSVESRFNLFCQSPESDFSGMENIDMYAYTAFKNAIVGGDVLVVLRYVDNKVTMQLIDGAHIQSPGYGNDYWPQILPNGNKIINGIEMDKSGKHVRYYVRKEDLSFVEIEAFGKESGLQMAFLVYGLRYRLNNYRGIPLVSTVLETLKKMERYKEATVGSAEERQKITFQVVHQQYSTGSNPLLQQMAKAYDADARNADLPTTEEGKQLADKVAATTNKATFNMPVGAELKGLDSKNELYFKDFYSVNIDLICAALGIPPEVAMSKYDSNFSASRAALKDWEHTLNVARKSFAYMYYRPIYNFWLEVQILKNKVQAPGYLQARYAGNSEVLNAYRKARFVGAPVPHIDPEKEVKAERLKLGLSAANIPLTTVEAATESLNGGESDANMEQYANEYKKAETLGIVRNVSSVAPPSGQAPNQ
jgi:capsid protein